MSIIQTVRRIFCDAFCGLFSSSTIKINARRMKFLRLLGEGGFSYVYLVEEIATGNRYALKKIMCPLGQESVETALKEVKAYGLFSHPTIIQAIDHVVVQDKSGSKVVYILLPYYEKGNLQDLINKNVVTNERISERQALCYVRDICAALSQLHNYDASTEEFFEENSDQSHIPLMYAADYRDTETDITHQSATHRPYAHYDLKPGNIMIDNEDRLVLMDFGSCKPAREHVLSRSEALRIQDLAAEQSTMPYRAPELFDCRTGSTIDEKVDIWSVGCLLFALLYGHSPFETVQTETGSIALAVLNCQYQLPAVHEQIYSESIRDLIRVCLVLDITERPTAKALLFRVVKLLDVADRV